jgi:hypothetical protein
MPKVVERLIQFTLFPAIFGILFSGCGESGPSVSNEGGNSLKRVYILYTGSSGAADYAVYDAAANTMADEVYKNSNGGRTLNLTAGDMKLNNNMLYITALGPLFSSQGTIYKLNTGDNTVSDSLRVNWNPYGFVINNGNIVVSNLNGSFVSKFDLDFNIIEDSISVGPGPANIIYGMTYYVVSKSSSTSERSLSFVNEYNNIVTKLFYTSPPVSTVFNVNGFFVSGFNSKKIFRINRESIETIDSFTVPTSMPSISELIFKNQSKFFVLASNKELWEAEMTVTGLIFRNIFPSNPDVTILNAAYESTKNEIYIAHATDQFSNGKMIIVDAESGMVKSTHQLGGRSPARFAFMY